MNALVYGVGHSGTTILTKMLVELGWNIAACDFNFEPIDIRAINMALYGDISVLPNLMEDNLNKLVRPYVIKDPRFIFTIPTWLDAFKTQPDPPLLIWIKRQYQDVYNSYLKRQETDNGDNGLIPTKGGAKSVEQLYAQAKIGYDLWPWHKITIEYAKLQNAVLLFNPNQLTNSFGTL